MKRPEQEIKSGGNWREGKWQWGIRILKGVGENWKLKAVVQERIEFASK